MPSIVPLCLKILFVFNMSLLRNSVLTSFGEYSTLVEYILLTKVGQAPCTVLSFSVKSYGETLVQMGINDFDFLIYLENGQSIEIFFIGDIIYFILYLPITLFINSINLL